MKPNTRKRLTRIIASALLAGEFTRAEAEEIASAFEFSDELLRDVGRIYRDIFRRTEVDGDAKAIPETTDPRRVRVSMLVDMAYEAVQRRRMSREELLHEMGRIDPHARYALGNAKLPVREILYLFFADAPTDQAMRLLDRLGPSSTTSSSVTDKYLDAIRNRENR